MTNPIAKVRRKLKLTQEKLFIGAGIFLFLVLVGFAVFAIIFLNNNIAPIFPSNGGSGSGVIEFNIEGYNALNL